MPKSSETKKVLGSQRKLNFDDDDAAGRNVAARSDTKRSIPSFTTSTDTPQQQSKKRKPNVKEQSKVESFVSPQKTARNNINIAAVNIVTPPSNDEDFVVTGRTPSKLDPIDDSKNIDDDTAYIPSYIHKNVEYIRKGELSKLSPIESKLLQYITKHYVIPHDFESNRIYGPLSGTTYMHRLTMAYRLGSLQPKQQGPTTTENDVLLSVICTTCAALGHTADECPTTV